MYRLIACATGLLLSVSPLSVLAQPGEATFEGLGDLSGGIFESRALGVSGDGAVVVGRASSDSTDFEGFRWMDGNMEALGFLGSFLSTTAAAVSSDGSVVTGISSLEAFRWEASADTLEGLGFLPGAFFNSGGNDVSADGSVVVGYSNTASAVEAFRWEAGADTMIGLGNLGPQGSSRAHGVSADGSIVVGEGQHPVCTIQPNTRAFRWEDGTMVDLGVLAVNGCGTSRAHAISADGFVIVGGATSDNGGNGIEAFRWEDDEMVGLGDLPDPNEIFYSEAYAVSADGSVVVGHSSADGLEAFIWTEIDGMRNLRTVLQEDYGLDLTGWMLRQATGISDDGTVIVGWGINPDGNEEAWRAFLPPPVKPPVNDNVADAIEITPDGTFLGTNVGATTEDDVPPMSCGFGDRVDVWWRFTAGASGEITISTEGSDFNTVLSLHTTDLAEVACNDNAPRPGFPVMWSELREIPVVEDSSYYVRVAGALIAEGAIQLNVDPIVLPPPDNDDIANAIEIPTEDETYEGSNENATLEDGEPEPSCTFSDWTTNFSVWWTFTPEDDGLATINTNGSLTPDGDGLDTILSLHNSSDLSEVACDDDSGEGLQSLIEEASVTAGETYLIRVAGYNESLINQGSIQLTTVFQFGIADEATPKEIAEGLSLPGPNPARGASTLTVAVENGQDVSVEVFDVTGRRIQTLYEGTLAAGTSETLTLNAATLPAGVYVIRATGEDFTKSRRLTVVR